MIWYFRVKLAKLLITLIRRGILPHGHSYRYALRIPTLDKVDYFNLKNAPLYDGEKLRGD